MHLTFSELEATQSLGIKQEDAWKLGAAGLHRGSHRSLLAHRNMLSWKVPSVPFAADRLGGKEDGTSFQVPGER